MVDVHGEVANGFGPVADRFAQNFDEYDERGAACCLYLNGEKMVDVWAGVADVETGRAYEQDALQVVFSTTKGATAIAALRLVQDGRLDLDAPVASYWPEFAAAGKEAVPVRWLLSHRAGLPVVDAELSREEVLAVGPIVDALAAQTPVWEPGTDHGYHAITYGWLVAEVVRRITGQSLGSFFADDIAAPLGLDFWIGLPEEQEPRVATLVSPPQPETPEQIAFAKKAFAKDGLAIRALGMGVVDLRDMGGSFNKRDMHATEMPGANGITDARSLARLYAATIDEVDGVRLLDDDTIAVAIEPQSFGVDRTLTVETRFGLGFMLPGPMEPLIGPRSFGHPGAGGSLGVADPDLGIGFGYTMNRMRLGVLGDPRPYAILDAVKDCL